jgi:hypothetical protein
MGMRLLVCGVAILAGLATDAHAGQQDGSWQVGLSTFVSSGDYGTDDTTRLTYTALSARRSFPRGDLTIRVPWLDVRSDGTVIVYRNVPQPIITTRPGATRPGTTVTTPVPVRHTTRETGVGDISVAGRVFLIPSARSASSVDLTMRIELPTGDATRGLGLGKASAEVGLEVTQPMGSTFLALADASFTAAGRPDAFDVRNPWEYALGIGAYAGRAVLLSASYEQWRPVIPGTPMGRDVLVAATIAAGRFRIQTSAQLPLSDQAPDFGAGAGLAVRF